ncbi:MAG TPA: hypothetical protein VF883_21360 [Thermoanaerobaculia bacterium]
MHPRAVFLVAGVSRDLERHRFRGIIDESSLALYEFAGARLQFKPGATGTIMIELSQGSQGVGRSVLSAVRHGAAATDRSR